MVYSTSGVHRRGWPPRDQSIPLRDRAKIGILPEVRRGGSGPHSGAAVAEIRSALEITMKRQEMKCVWSPVGVYVLAVSFVLCAGFVVSGCKKARTPEKVTQETVEKAPKTPTETPAKLPEVETSEEAPPAPARGPAPDSSTPAMTL